MKWVRQITTIEKENLTEMSFSKTKFDLKQEFNQKIKEKKQF